MRIKTNKGIIKQLEVIEDALVAGQVSWDSIKNEADYPEHESDVATGDNLFYRAFEALNKLKEKFQ